MNAQKTSKAIKQLEYAKALQDYQILWNGIITYWIALAVGLIIAHITDKLAFDVFFVSIISISALGTILILFELGNLTDRIQEIQEKTDNEDGNTSLF